MLAKSELTELNQDGNDDIGKSISLWVVLEDLNGITVIDPCLVGCPVQTVVERLITCCVEGYQVPNSSRDLE